MASWVWPSWCSRNFPSYHRFLGRAPPPFQVIVCFCFLVSFPISAASYAPCAQGPWRAFSGYFCSLSLGLCGGCSLLFSEWGGKILALWLHSNGGGNCWGADRGTACCPPERSLLTRAMPGSWGRAAVGSPSCQPPPCARISPTLPAVQGINWTCKGVSCLAGFAL